MASLVGCLLILLITGCNVSSCISCARTIFADLSPGLGPDRSRSKQGTGELYPKPISKDKKSSVRVWGKWNDLYPYQLRWSRYCFKHVCTKISNQIDSMILLRKGHGRMEFLKTVLFARLEVSPPWFHSGDIGYINKFWMQSFEHHGRLMGCFHQRATRPQHVEELRKHWLQRSQRVPSVNLYILYKLQTYKKDNISYIYKNDLPYD